MNSLNLEVKSQGHDHTKYWWRKVEALTSGSGVEA